jgi:hypothetical protein
MHTGTYNRLGVHVSATDLEVARALWQRFDPDARRDPKLKAARKAVLAAVLEAHHNWQDTCAKWRM